MRDSKSGLCTSVCYCPKANAHDVWNPTSCCERDIGPQKRASVPLHRTGPNPAPRSRSRAREWEARLSLDLRNDEAVAGPPSATDVGCPFHTDGGRIQQGEQKTLVLTGASRGIGHATGKLFSEAGWRIISCARRPFDGGRCPWESGADNHVQVDLSNHRMLARHRRGQGAPRGRAIARIDQQCRHFTEDAEWRTTDGVDDVSRDLDEGIPPQSGGADPARARPV